MSNNRTVGVLNTLGVYFFNLKKVKRSICFVPVGRLSHASATTLVVDLSKYLCHSNITIRSLLTDAGFSVTLLCTGLLSTEVKVSILINVTTTSDDDSLYLNIRRKKTCFRREPDLFTSSDFNKPIMAVLECLYQYFFRKRVTFEI